MRLNRKRIAQVLVATAGLAMFLPWQTSTTVDGSKSVQGAAVDEGQIIIVVCIVTIALVYIGWRPAWIGAGFCLATGIRELLDLSEAGDPDPASGLWVMTGASAVAAALLIWEMFTTLDRDEQASGGDNKRPGRGLGGSLGRRQR